MVKKKKTYQPGERRPAGKQLDGRYRGKLKVGVDADGNDIYKYVSGRTKDERDANLEELRKEYTFGIDKVERDVTVSTYVEKWFKIYKLPHIAGSNRRTYRTVLDAHYLYIFGDRQLRSIRRMEIQEFLNERSHYKKSYMKKIIMVGRQFFRDAVEDGYIDRNPMTKLKIPECAEGGRRALTLAERAAVMSTINSETNALLIAILYYIGLRPGEALGLQWGDFDFDKKNVHIQRDIDYADTPDGLIDTLKNEPSDRIVPVPDTLIRMLLPRRGFKSVFVIQSPSTGQWLNSTENDQLWDRLMRRAYDNNPAIAHRDSNNSHAEKRARLQRSVLTAYFLRHNYATMLHAKGIDAVTASKWMGHKDPRTMMQFYLDLDEAKEHIDTTLLDGVFDEVAK
jgi:integrase